MPWIVRAQHLAHGNDADTLTASNAQPRDAKVVQVLALQLGIAHIKPPELSEIGHPGQLERLCRHAIVLQVWDPCISTDQCISSSSSSRRA